MATQLNIILDYSSAFKAIIAHFADSADQGRWFIVNHDDEEDPNTLAHFLHIQYADLECLLKKIGIIIPVR